MNNKIKKVYKIIMLIIVVALITFVFTSAYLYKKLGTNAKISAYSNISGINSKFIQKISILKNIIDTNYISDVNEEKLVNGAIKGYVDGLGDEYTQYFTKEEMEEFLTETEGSYVGIGIYMVQDIEEKAIVILSPIKGSPAEKAGLLPGDIIKKVDGVEYTVDDFEKIASYIKGKEGTKVKLEIERDGKILTFEVERKKVELYPIESKVLQNNIGYINITSFDSGCAKEFKQTYDNLTKKKITSLIIDLRNNGGGLVEEALKIADYMLEKDKIMLITKDKNQNEEIEKSTNNLLVKVPIVVLVNENTASASEILAAALKENEKATLVGQKTFGKGVIQELITLSDGSGIKVTTEEYYTPNRNKINEIGIKPNKEIALPEEVVDSYEIEEKYDTQLQEAIKLLKNKEK